VLHNRRNRFQNSQNSCYTIEGIEGIQGIPDPSASVFRTRNDENVTIKKPGNNEVVLL
jgi:hypothetical protein